MLADANATPPLGIEGVDMMDRGEVRSGKTCWGAIGFGTLKLALHRACIAKLFESNDQVSRRRGDLRAGENHVVDKVSLRDQ